ncbi:MAG: serine hydrolase [Pseudomonadota bacterium]
MKHFLLLAVGLLVLSVASTQPAGDDGFERIRERAEALAPLNSLLIWHADSLVVEEYFRGMSRERSFNIKSASKSVLSALVGIAVEDGHLEELDQPLHTLLPEAFEGEDEAKKAITLEHALKMRTGLETTSFGNYGAWVQSRDWVGFQVRQPIECPPDRCWSYSTGTSHLLSAILTRQTGQSTFQYARRALFDPLGIRIDGWDRDPSGIYLGGNNMAMRPRDLLRFGRLYLQNGVWNGQRLLSEEWIERSWGSYAVSPWNGHNYGYMWWNTTLAGEKAYFAWGYGGQFLFVVPDLDLAVVISSSLSNRPAGSGRHNQRVHRFMSQQVVPAFQSEAHRNTASAR